ncbi:MAG: AAA family ATPase [Candidatus Omnitrophota bacterium]
MIIAFVHHKGGTGKTTACLNVAGWLVKMGKNVLVVDLDPQGNATTGLGIERKSVDYSIYDVLFPCLPAGRGEKNLQDIILETTCGVHLVPSSIDLLAAETHMAGISNQTHLLKDHLSEVKKYYDYILIDVPPGSTMLMINGIVAAENIIIPLDSGVFAYETMETLRTLLRDMAEELGIETFYRSYLQTYLERDIRQIRSVEDLSVFQNFLELLAARVGNLLNLSEIGKECGISHTTVQKWLTLLEVTRIIYLLRPYHSNISKRVVKRPKIYFTDTGLLSNLLKYSDAATLLAGPAKGAIFENFMVMEALKNKFNHNRNYELYFYRDSNDNEIDLLVDYGQKIKLMEIKAAKSLREDFFAVLSKSHDLFKNKKAEMYLVGLFDTKIKHAGIETVSFEEFNRIL